MDIIMPILQVRGQRLSQVSAWRQNWNPKIGTSFLEHSVQSGSMVSKIPGIISLILQKRKLRHRGAKELADTAKLLSRGTRQTPSPSSPMPTSQLSFRGSSKETKLKLPFDLGSHSLSGSGNRVLQIII